MLRMSCLIVCFVYFELKKIANLNQKEVSLLPSFQLFPLKIMAK